MFDLSPLCGPKRTPPTTTDLWVHALENSKGQKPKSPVVKPTSLYPALEAGIDSPSQGPLRMAGTELQSRRKVLVISA